MWRIKFIANRGGWFDNSDLYRCSAFRFFMFPFLKWIKEHNINPFHAKVPFLYRQSKGFLTFSGDIEMGHC